MRAALYIRVSSAIQAKEGDSIPAQLDALNKYAFERKYEIIGTFVDDGISGTKFDRDELQNLLSLVESDSIDIIIFTKLDRWFRSIRHYTATQAILDEHHVGWLAIWEPIYDTTTPAGRLIVNQMMSIAQFEAENTSSRIKQVFAFKAQKGEVLSGSATPGYSIVNKHLVPNEQAADVVRAFQTYDRTGSLNETIRAMIGTGLPVSNSGMKRLLMRKVYIGERNGKTDFCEPIVGRDLFERVQLGLSRNIKSNQRNVYLFSGLLRCVECGAMMSSHSRKHGNKRISIYRCRRHYESKTDKCVNTRTITDAALEKMMLGILPNAIVEQVEINEKKTAHAVSYERQQAALEKKVERLKILFINEEISLEEYKRDKRAILDQIAALAPVTRPEPPQAVLALEGLNISEIYENLTREERRAFWRGIIKEIRFDKDRNFYFDFL